MIGRMTAFEVIQKQEEYRKRTINLVAKMLEEGHSKGDIAEECGISKSELKVIENALNSNTKTNKRQTYRRFF